MLDIVQAVRELNGLFGPGIFRDAKRDLWEYGVVRKRQGRLNAHHIEVGHMANLEGVDAISREDESHFVGGLSCNLRSVLLGTKFM